MNVIYLDNNATTQPAPSVVEAVDTALREYWANPSSMHRPGQRVRQQVDLARHEVARLIGAAEREIIFTSGGTESANLAIRGVISRSAARTRSVIVTSRLEHSAVRETAEESETRGTEVIWLPNDDRGLVDLDALRDVLSRRGREIALVSIMPANNETGVLQPISEIGAMCREHGVLYHADATQCVGRMPLDLRREPIDLLTFSAHKFHGPKGVGALYVREDVRISAHLTGGPQERERRGGTENVSGILGFGEAARLARKWLADESAIKRQATLRDALESAVLDALPGALINGAGAPRLWNTSNIALPGVEAEPVLLALSERGVCASAGAACSSGSLDPSPVLLAMHLDEARVAGSIRFSMSRETAREEIDAAVEVIVETATRLAERVARDGIQGGR